MCANPEKLFVIFLVKKNRPLANIAEHFLTKLELPTFLYEIICFLPFAKQIIIIIA